jgi:hypothetical protein
MAKLMGCSDLTGQREICSCNHMSKKKKYLKLTMQLYRKLLNHTHNSAALIANASTKILVSKNFLQSLTARR